MAALALRQQFGINFLNFIILKRALGQITDPPNLCLLMKCVHQVHQQLVSVLLLANKKPFRNRANSLDKFLRFDIIFSSYKALT